MQLTQIAVDDFYPAPQAVARIARNLDYKSEEYEGFTYHNIGLGYEPEGVSDCLSKVFGSPVDIKMQYFRLGTDKGDLTYWIHADSSIAQWAAVWYLSDAPAGVVAGTAFWQHKKLGIDHVPSLADVEGLFHNSDDPAAAFDKRIQLDGNDEDKWQMSGLIANKFNRVAIYPGNYYHSRYPQGGWGKDKSDGRIVWTAFFSTH